MSGAGVWRPQRATGIFSVAVLLLLSACNREAPLRHSQFLAFGTLVEITLYDVDEATAQRAEQAIEQDFQNWDRDWHAWRPSALTAINARLAQRQTAPVDGALRDLIVRARALSLASDNLFDPALGRLFALWGFQRDEPEGPPPAPDKVHALLAHLPTMADLHIGKNSLRSDNPAVQLDFGAIAKGFAAQRAIEHLHGLGIRNAIVAAAGDLHVLGRHGARAWHIGIRDPRAPGVIAAVDLNSGESISTSGDYERYFTWQGKRYHHLLDPRSGAPAQGTRAVTVIARDGATADAAATALFIAGPHAWPRIARAMGVDTVLLIDAAGTVQMSPPMAARLQFVRVPEPPHVIKALP